ncbi:MAG: hypothetical protein JNM56_40170 [Planctomycetia bacterium]|nr:hypothetical protein [Planctomycetia bacterium]
MRCKEAYICLLAAQHPRRPPAELREHLERCAACRKRQHRLLELEAEIRALPQPEETLDARLRFQEQLDQLPPLAVVPAPAPEARPRRRSLWPFVGLTACAMLVFGLAWVLSRPSGLPGTFAIATRPRTPGGPAEATVARILEKDLQLAAAADSRQQLTALNDIAAELSVEVRRLSREGPVEDVLLVGGLYERVVCQGLVRRAQTLPAAEREGLVAELVKQLDRSAQEADGAVAAALPGAADGLRNLAIAARQAGGSLTGSAAPPEPRTPAWQPAQSGTLRDLLGTLVLQALLLAEENDPLRRADHCNAVAEQLVQGILLASSGGDSARAEHLGGLLGHVMERGIAPNLERIDLKNADPPRRAEAERVEQRTGQAVEVLQRNLEKAPPVAQPALRKALEAAAQEQGPGQPGKGKGKKDKGGKGGPPALPPGLQKKG